MTGFLVTVSKIINVVAVGATVVDKVRPYAQGVYQSRSSWKKARDKVRLATKFSRFIYNRGHSKGYRQGASGALREERLLIARRLLKMGVDVKTVRRATKVSRNEEL